ncbi:MAG: pyridoxal-phosphate dependent enzyme, partial [Rickettsiales bacterium]|nr:pyridoxal-phosphate dependent enzyme [Rickettsiales bacterium]
DAVFAACGGGGLVSGAWLAAQGVSKDIEVFAAEPAMANDAAQSVRAGHIIGFEQTPMTIADGARTLKVTELCYAYLTQLAGFYEVEEHAIVYWTQWLSHLLKVAVEPTAALAMGAASQWLTAQGSKKRVVVLLSGGNLDAATQRKIWQESYLGTVPSI